MWRSRALLDGGDLYQISIRGETFAKDDLNTSIHDETVALVLIGGQGENVGFREICPLRPASLDVVNLCGPVCAT